MTTLRIRASVVLSGVFCGWYIVLQFVRFFNGNVSYKHSNLFQQWREALVFSLICVWINDWVNNREAGDLRCYRAHYDVIAMTFLRCVLKNMDSRSCRFALKNDELRQHLKHVVLTVDHPWGIQNNFVFVLLQWMPSWHYVCCSRGSLWQ